MRLTHVPYTTSHRSGQARSPKRAAGPKPRYGDGMGYMCVLERGFAEHLQRAIHLSYLQFISKLLNTGRSDRHFPTQFENLRPASTPTSRFPTGIDYLLITFTFLPSPACLMIKVISEVSKHIDCMIKSILVILFG